MTQNWRSCTPAWQYGVPTRYDSPPGGKNVTKTTMTVFPRLIILIAALAALASLATLGATQTLASRGLQSLALEQHNLRRGYVVTSTVYHPEWYIARTYHVSMARLNAHGWLASYEALFTRHDIGILDEVGNKLDQYVGPVGAHWGYRVAVQNVLCCGKYRALALPTVGDESTGFIATAGNGTGFIGMKFRQGKFVADVAILPRQREASLLLLARVEDQKIRAHR